MLANMRTSSAWNACAPRFFVLFFFPYFFRFSFFVFFFFLCSFFLGQCGVLARSVKECVDREHHAELSIASLTQHQGSTSFFPGSPSFCFSDIYVRTRNTHTILQTPELFSGRGMGGWPAVTSQPNFPFFDHSCVCPPRRILAVAVTVSLVPRPDPNASFISVCP